MSDNDGNRTTKGIEEVLSKELDEFYKKHNIQLTYDTLTAPPLHRFIRLNPRYDVDETLELLTKEIEDYITIANPTNMMQHYQHH